MPCHDGREEQWERESKAHHTSIEQLLEEVLMLRYANGRGVVPDSYRRRYDKLCISYAAEMLMEIKGPYWEERLLNGHVTADQLNPDD